MKHAAPAPPELGTSDGLSYALFLPEGEPETGVVILPGAGSAKESHFDFARGCRDEGMAALAFDARGHGRSEGEFGPGALDDVLAMVALLRAHAPQVALRGSSMGGFAAIHAAGPRPGALRRGGDLPRARGGPASMLALGRTARSAFAATWRPPRSGSSRSTSTAPSGGSGARTGLLLLHARGDEQVPYTVSEQLFAAAHEPKRLLLLPGGHHRSLQHDLELQAVSRRFVRKAASARAVLRTILV